MKISEQTLGADVKAGKLARVYFLYGEEDFLIRMYTNKILALAVREDEREMNYRRYSFTPKADKNSQGECPVEVSELADFVDSLPFFAERKCVLLNNIDTELFDKRELEEYIKVINDIPETSVIIVTRENVENDAKKFKKKMESAGMKKLLEEADKNGIVCELNAFPLSKQEGMAISKCRRAGCELSNENAAYLAERIGGSLTVLQSEIEKLCAYRQNGEITREDIEALVPERIECNIFDLAKELFAGHTGRALEIINALFAQKEEPDSVMSVLSMYFVDLYRARLGIAAKKTYSQAAAELNLGNRAFVMRNAYSAAKNLSEEYLADCVAVLYNANKLLHSSNDDKQRIIERCVVELASILR